MSRTHHSFRPQLEAFDERLTPGSILGTPESPLDSAFIPVALAAQQQGATETTKDVIRLSDGSVVGSSTLMRTAEGVIAKERAAPYRPGERTGMAKIKRVRTIDAVVMGWRPGKAENTVGSLILGLYNEAGELVAQTDERPGDGALPPGNWLPGIIHDTMEVDVNSVQPGRYQVAIGLYDPISFERLAPSTGGDAENRLFIGEVEIPADG